MRRKLLLWTLLAALLYFAGPAPFRGVALSQTDDWLPVPRPLWTAQIYRNGQYLDSMRLPLDAFSLPIPGFWRCEISAEYLHKREEELAVSRRTVCRGPAGDHVTMSTICALAATPSATTAIMLHDGPPLTSAYTKLLIICVLNGD